MEFGCCTYQGAEAAGGQAFNIIDIHGNQHQGIKIRDIPPWIVLLSLRDSFVRCFAVQGEKRK